jgi:hypothetical protein
MILVAVQILLQVATVNTEMEHAILPVNELTKEVQPKENVQLVLEFVVYLH